jgi:uncharacterized cupin superfamily protein
MRASGRAADAFDARTAQVASRIGAQKLGFNVTAVPAGKAAFPFHSHRVNEELFFVLQGSGEVRVGKDTYPIREGDFIACPPGGPETAHQIRNTGDEELRYLAVSTLAYPEVVEYPDSAKFGVYARVPGAPPGTAGEFRHIGRQSLAVGYWEGEGPAEGGG